MSLKIKFDATVLAQACTEYAAEVERDIKNSVEGLSRIAYDKMRDLASQELESTRKIFIDNLQSPVQLADGVWIISLGEKALFIEEGLAPGFDMKPGLLTDGEYSEKTGYRYRVVPFEHGKPPSQASESARELITKLRKGLKEYNKKEGNKVKIPWKTIERNPNGSPKLGKLHSINLPSDIPGKGNTPSLYRVSIYQTMVNGNVRRDITTFRTVTANPDSKDKWIHPGIEAKKIMDEAADWAEKEFYRTIYPEILKKWDK